MCKCFFFRCMTNCFARALFSDEYCDFVRFLAQPWNISSRFIMHWWHFAWYLIKVFTYISTSTLWTANYPLSFKNKQSFEFIKEKIRHSWHISRDTWIMAQKRASDIGYNGTIKNSKWGGEISFEIIIVQLKGPRKSPTIFHSIPWAQVSSKNNPENKIVIV